MKIIIGIGFALFLLSLVLAISGDHAYLTSGSIIGGSSLIALAIFNKK